MSKQVVAERWARMIGGSALVGLITGAVILVVKTVVLESENGCCRRIRG